MAADEVLLESAAAGVASLRFYTWTEATVSLGYFQPAAAVAGDGRLASLPLIRRPTGGETLVHDHELTYALALPAGRPWQDGPWMPRMHRSIAAALAGLGIASQLAAEEAASATPLCFLHPTPGDLLVAGAKVAGSAQRKRKGALLQHGAVLLARSPHTPSLPGIRELAGVDLDPVVLRAMIEQRFRDETGWDITASDWSAAEQRRIEDLCETKYAQAWWNRKR